jgi:hypothetical protein
MKLDYPSDARQKTGTHIMAGISVPDTAIIDRAIEYARQKCELYLFRSIGF